MRKLQKSAESKLEAEQWWQLLWLLSSTTDSRAGTTKHACPLNIQVLLLYYIFPAVYSINKTLPAPDKKNLTSQLNPK